MEYELKPRQICFFIISFFPVAKLFMMASVVSALANEDTWLSVLINLSLDLISIFSIIYISKKTDKTFFELITDTFGKLGAKFILFLYLVFFLLKSILPVCEAKDYMRLTLFVTKPNSTNFLPFFILAFYLCLKRLRVLGRIADLTFLLTVTGFSVLFFLSLGNSDFSAILPVGANGLTNILKGSYKGLNWFGDACYLMFFIGEFDTQKKAGTKIIISYLINVVIITLFAISFYGVFSSIASKQKFSLTEAVKYDNAINFTGRFDYFGIVLILFSNFFAMILPLFFACKILDRIFEVKYKWISALIVVAFSFTVVILFSDYFASIENFIINYASGYFLVLGNVLPALSPLLLLKNKQCKEKEYEVC